MSNKVGAYIEKHSPEIMTGIGIAGMFLTIGLSIAATPKAMRSIKETKKKKHKDKLTPKEFIGATWKYYIIPLVTSAASTACLIGSNRISNKRSAALATACALSESALSRYSEKVIETLGEKKEKEIRDKVYEDVIAEHPVSKSEVYISTNGNVLCYDDMSGRYFKSDKSRIEKAANLINRRLRDEMFVALNEFYSELNLPSVGSGELLGFDIDHAYLDPKWSTQLAEDGTPVLVVLYREQVVVKHGAR